jgi:uncharacterized protein with FMN-binding domain
MRRSVATILGTLAGTGLLVGAKLGTHPATDPAADPLAVAAPTSADPPAASSRPGTKPTAGSKASPTRAKAAAAFKNGTFTGAGASERYGTITVTITISGGRLTNASATCSGCNGTSRSISGGAFPTLRKEALAAQSARGVNTVTGATYTSSAYRTSLQSALDAAKA